MQKILVGADPELFVKLDGMLVTGHGLVPGTKANPFPVRNGAVQVDGMALEFNIDPASSGVEFVNNIVSVMAQLKKMIPQHEFLIEATVRFEEAYLRQMPAVALELGCEPDFNAYTGEENPSPDADATMRTAAGHIHVGWTEVEDYKGGEHMNLCHGLAKQMDLFLGVPFVILNDCPKRKAMYGKAGTFRPKPYGMEYRVLSNKWLLNEVLMLFVYTNTIRAIKEMMADAPWFLTYPDGEDVINNNDKDRAEVIVEEMGIWMEDVICS